MNQNLRWKLLAIFGIFVIFFTLGVYPVLAPRYHLPLPAWLSAKQLKLGLDLKGGVHLVLRVQTEQAIQAATTTTAEQIREELKTANVPVGAINTTSPTGFHVEGVPQDRDADFRRIADTQAGDQLRPAARRSRRLRLHDEAEHREGSPRAGCRSRRSIRSTAASTSWALPSRTSPATVRPAIRFSCSSRACPTSAMRRRSSGRRRSSS